MKMLFRSSGKFLVLFFSLIVLLPVFSTGHEAEESSTGGGEKGILFIAMGPSNNFVMIDIATEKVMKLSPVL
ncbi:MAG: hypothetical protein GTO13_03710 [Proteobacteria bacterium]|nr:hypothetical protein [Pseudomonadota bacterium]